MINVSDVYKQAIRNDQREYREQAIITLNDPDHPNTTLTLTNTDLWSDGFSIEDAVSADNTFQIGAAIINKATLVINNIYGTYTDYDFNLADVTLRIGLAVETDVETNIIPEPGVANRWINGYIDASGDIASQSSNYREMVSDFIPVKGGREYTAEYNFIQTPSASAWTQISAYDHNRNFIGNYSEEKQATGQAITYVKQLPLNVAYIRLSLRTFDMISTFTFDETSLAAYYTKGKYIVNSASYNGSLITLECYDYMCKLDFPYTSMLTWPATPNDIVRNACNLCGLAYSGKTFPHQSAIRLRQPEDGAITFRDVISYVAQLCGCYVRCNANGQLELSWYNQDALETETPSGSGSNVYHINSIYNKDISVTNVVPSVISITYDTDNPNDVEENESARLSDWQSGSSYSIGEPCKYNDKVWRSLVDNNTTEPTLSVTTKWRYVADATSTYIIEIEKNPFITEDNVTTIREWLGLQLLGRAFRKATISHGSDPSIEAGDVAIAIMPDGATYYPILISKTTFSVGSPQTSISAAENPVKNASTKYTVDTKNMVAVRRMIRKQLTTRDAAYSDLVHALSDYGGLYLTEEPDDVNGGTIYYLHDKSTLAQSTTVYKITAGGWGISTDGGVTYNTGITAYGVAVFNMLSATGISFDWAEGGTITLGGAENGNGILVVKDAGDHEVAKIDNERFLFGKSYDTESSVLSIDYEKAILEIENPNGIYIADDDMVSTIIHISVTDEEDGVVCYSTNGHGRWRIRYASNGINFERYGTGNTWTKLASIFVETKENASHISVPTGRLMLKNVFPLSAETNNETITPIYNYIEEEELFPPWKNWSTLGNCWYYKLGVRVHIHIAATSFTANTNQELITMPVNYRPNKLITACGRGQRGTDYASAWITSSGVVTFISESTSCCVDLEYDAVQ